jgi:hypothetical protein
MQESIKGIDLAIEALKSRASVLVEEVHQILKTQKPQKQNPEDPAEKRAKAIWVHLKERNGYNTFSIIWSKLKYFHHQSRRSFFEDVARGRSYQLTRGRFMAIVRGYHPQIQEELWGYEQLFGEIRHRQALLSQARTFLIQYQKRAAKPI